MVVVLIAAAALVVTSAPRANMQAANLVSTQIGQVKRTTLSAVFALSGRTQPPKPPNFCFFGVWAGARVKFEGGGYLTHGGAVVKTVHPPV